MIKGMNGKLLRMGLAGGAAFGLDAWAEAEKDTKPALGYINTAFRYAWIPALMPGIVPFRIPPVVRELLIGAAIPQILEFAQGKTVELMAATLPAEDNSTITTDPADTIGVMA